ncbi:MAG: L-threonine 3-dehydrogenase [Nitrososphaerota archaeon]|nr:L-threonine 3-dehydrogenase [Nitrososphaerota archaeon]
MEDVADPRISPRQVLVRVMATSICGTDVHVYDFDEWAGSRVKPPFVMGHEFSGEVVEAGRDVATLSVGDHVSGETHIPCMACDQCRSGNHHICESLKLRGVDVDGCFAELVAVDEGTSWRNDSALPHEVASIQEPLGNAVHTVFEGGGVEGKTVAVFGCGPIGMAAVALCRQSGAEKVFAVDISDYRLGLAQSFGAERLINARKEDVVKAVLSETGGRGVDVFLEMAGARDAVVQGLKVLKAGGRASLLGLTDGPVPIDVTSDIVLKNVTIHGIFGRKMFSTWYTASSYVRSGRIDLSRLITHRFALAEFERAFELMKTGNSGKIVMRP